MCATWEHQFHLMEKATVAHKVQAVLASASEKEFMSVVSINAGVKNTPIMPSDLTCANTIFGCSRCNVQGKTVRLKSARVYTDRHRDENIAFQAASGLVTRFPRDVAFFG